MIEINPDTYSQIMELINKNKYPSVESFVDISLRNQLIMEKSSTIEREVRKTHSNVSVPLLSIIDEEYNYFVQNRPSLNKDEAITGLINRVAPAKIVLRVLSNLLNNSKTSFIDLNYFKDQVISKLIDIRVQIDKYEKKNRVNRGYSLSSGLPKKDPKSQKRFSDFYIGRLRTDNNIDGILGDLGLINIIRDVNDFNLTIGITKDGFKWANMKSPLIDDLINNNVAIKHPLSKEEILFYLAHLKHTKPGEYSFLDFLMKSIKGSYNTPPKLNERLSEFYKDRYSDAERNTLRAGGITRLIEMRAIKIMKEGLNSIYRTSNNCESLENFENSLEES